MICMVKLLLMKLITRENLLLEKWERWKRSMIYSLKLKQKGKLGISDTVKWEEYKALFPEDALANKKWLQGTLGDYKRWIGDYWSFSKRHEFVPGSLYKLSVPGVMPFVIRIEDPIEAYQIKQTLTTLAAMPPGESKVVVINYQHQVANIRNSRGSWSLRNQQDESDHNLFDMSNFAIANTLQDGSVDLVSLWGEHVRTISADERNKANEAFWLWKMSMYTPEFRDAAAVAQHFQTEMKDIRGTFDQMATAKVDWENSSVLWAVFSQVIPIGSMDQFISIKGWLSAGDVEQIFMGATQLKSKISALRSNKTQGQLSDMKGQLEWLLEHIDEHRLTSTDEQQIKNALWAVNFLIQGAKPWWAFEQFTDIMTNPPNCQSQWTIYRTMKETTQRQWYQDTHNTSLCYWGCGFSCCYALHRRFVCYMTPSVIIYGWNLVRYGRVKIVTMVKWMVAKQSVYYNSKHWWQRICHGLQWSNWCRKSTTMRYDSGWTCRKS